MVGSEVFGVRGRGEKMTRAEWKARCAAQYRKRAGLTFEQSVEFAEACFEAQDDDFSNSADYNPESCADDDMECWESCSGEQA